MTGCSVSPEPHEGGDDHHSEAGNHQSHDYVDNYDNGDHHGLSIGKSGNVNSVNRVIFVVMDDTMSFIADSFDVVAR